MSISTTSPRRGARALRLGAGALVAGAAFAAVPAMANATTSTCTYNTSNKNMIVTDLSGDRTLRISRLGDQIRISDDDAGSSFCPIPGKFDTATVLNTERIAIFRSFDNMPGGITVDQRKGAFRPGATLESDGQSEIEISIIDDKPFTGFPQNRLTVYGTDEYDSVMVGAGGRINLGFDADVDIEPTTKPAAITVFGGGHGDDIWGSGVNAFGAPAPADVPLDLQGGEGNDLVVGGDKTDNVNGDAGDDRFISVDTVPSTPGGPAEDRLFGGAGFDTANVDPEDDPRVEQPIIGFPVGKLKLAPSVQRARAGEPARLKLSWTHPKAWKQLRQIKLSLEHAGETVGTIELDPHSERTTAGGDVKLAADRTRLTHHGKTVTAQLAVRLPSSLRGEAVRVEVEATDRDGKRQSEPLAGHIRLAK